MAKRPSSSKTSLKEIMSSDEMITEGDLSAVALLMRKIIHSMGIKPLEWENLTTAYYREKHGDDIKKIREEKGNLASALESDQPTWTRFEQMLQILGANSVDFTIVLNYPRNISVENSINLRFKGRGGKIDPEVTVVVDRLKDKQGDKK